MSGFDEGRDDAEAPIEMDEENQTNCSVGDLKSLATDFANMDVNADNIQQYRMALEEKRRNPNMFVPAPEKGNQDADFEDDLFADNCGIAEAEEALDQDVEDEDDYEDTPQEEERFLGSSWMDRRMNQGRMDVFVEGPDKTINRFEFGRMMNYLQCQTEVFQQQVKKEVGRLHARINELEGTNASLVEDMSKRDSAVASSIKGFAETLEAHLADISVTNTSVESQLDNFQSTMEKLDLVMDEVRKVKAYSMTFGQQRTALRVMLSHCKVRDPSHDKLVSLPPQAIDMILSESKPEEVLLCFPLGSVTPESRYDSYIKLLELHQMCIRRHNEHRK